MPAAVLLQHWQYWFVTDKASVIGQAVEINSSKTYLDSVIVVPATQ